MILVIWSLTVDMTDSMMKSGNISTHLLNALNHLVLVRRGKWGRAKEPLSRFHVTIGKRVSGGKICLYDHYKYIIKDIQCL